MSSMLARPSTFVDGERLGLLASTLWLAVC